MKDFKVNENSWHFKFNTKFLYKAYFDCGHNIWTYTKKEAG